MARIAVAASAVAGAAALGAGASLGAPGGSGQQQKVHSASANRAPIASLRPRHKRVRVGEKVLFDASRSRDPDGRIAYHLWDFDGDGIYERNSGDKARVRHVFEKAGKVRVGMIVVDDGGAYSARHARVNAVEASHERHRHARDHGARSEHHGHARVHAATRHKASPPKVHAQATPAKAAPPATVRAASSSSSVTIKDFKFIPKSLTVSVGTTVTWTNQDTSIHTATADDGSFDSGNLSKGGTFSYTFNKAGTFKYHCVPHATFMKASITVTASGGNSSSGSGSNFSSGDNGGSSSSSKKKSNLPFTGLEIGLVALAGIALLGAGEALRRRLARL